MDSHILFSSDKWARWERYLCICTVTDVQYSKYWKVNEMKLNQHMTKMTYITSWLTVQHNTSKGLFE